MDAYNPDMLQDVFYHLNNLKIKFTKLKISNNKDRDFVNLMDNFLEDCDLIQLLIESYDNLNFRKLCDVINYSLVKPDCHGVIVYVYRERLKNNLDEGKMDYKEFAV